MIRNEDYIAVPRSAAVKLIKDYQLANYSMQLFVYLFEKCNIDTVLSVPDVCEALGLSQEQFESSLQREMIKPFVSLPKRVYTLFDMAKLAARLHGHAQTRVVMRLPALDKVPERCLWPAVPGVMAAKRIDPVTGAKIPRPRMQVCHTASAQVEHSSTAVTGGSTSVAEAPADEDGPAPVKKQRMKTVAPEDLPAVLGIDPKSTDEGEAPLYPKKPRYPELPTYLEKQSMRKMRPAATEEGKPKKKRPKKKPADPSMPDDLDPALFADLPPMAESLDDFDALRLGLEEPDEGLI